MHARDIPACSGGQRALMPPLARLDHALCAAAASHLAAACRPAAAALDDVQRRLGAAWRPDERHCAAGVALGCPPRRECGCGIERNDLFFSRRLFDPQTRSTRPTAGEVARPASPLATPMRDGARRPPIDSPKPNDLDWSSSRVRLQVAARGPRCRSCIVVPQPHSPTDPNPNRSQ